MVFPISSSAHDNTKLKALKLLILMRPSNDDHDVDDKWIGSVFAIIGIRWMNEWQRRRNKMRTNVFRCERIVILVFALFLHRTFVGSTSGTGTSPPPAPPLKCCNSSLDDLHRVEIKFKITVVLNEYIVRFVDYYTPQIREDYVRAALNGSKVSVCCCFAHSICHSTTWLCFFRWITAEYYHDRIRPASIPVTLMWFYWKKMHRTMGWMRCVHIRRLRVSRLSEWCIVRSSTFRSMTK